MAPHSIETLLPAPQWPQSLSRFVTWCLMWDPRNRPTSHQALRHEYFADAVDPLLARSSTPRTIDRKHSEQNYRASKDATDIAPTLHTKSSWFRKSLISKDNAHVPQHISPVSPRSGPSVLSDAARPAAVANERPQAEKRATWAHGAGTSKAAPMPLLPMLRPISPLSDPVTAQANVRARKVNHATHAAAAEGAHRGAMDEKAVKKIGRQLSVASHGNHYAEIHRQEAERALNGSGGLVSPNGQKESFFSHLRKRARRLSGRPQLPLSPNSDDLEANAGCGPWSSNRSSMILDSPGMTNPGAAEFKELDKALQNVRYSVDMSNSGGNKQNQSASGDQMAKKRQQSIPPGQQVRANENGQVPSGNTGPISSRTRRAIQMSTHPVHRYETPDEEDELLDEVINSTRRAANHLGHQTPSDMGQERKDMSTDSYRSPIPQGAYNLGISNPYPTPSPSAKRNSVHFGQTSVVSKPVPIDVTHKGRAESTSLQPKWPTPPYEENDWADAAAASIFAAGAAYT